MKRVAGVVGVFTMLVVALVSAGAADKTPTVKEIMGKLNKGTDCVLQTLRKALKNEEPNWEEVQEQSKKFTELAEALGKNGPPRGEKESWEKLTKLYAEQARALNDAARGKDRTGAKAAHAKLAGSCKTCHDAHKPKMTAGS
jgi:cytochrome c556